MTAAILLLVLQCNPSWAAEKTPARVSPLSLLQAPLLLNSCLQAQKAGRPWKQAPELRRYLLSLSSGTKSPSLLPASQYLPCSFFDWWWSSTSSSCPWNPYKFQLQLISVFSNIFSLYPWISCPPLPSVLTSISCTPAFHQSSACTPCSPKPDLGHRHDWDAARIPGFESIWQTIV